MSAAPSGVAATPKYPRDHMKFPITGHMLSAAATTIAVVTMSPGAMYATYDTPPSTPVDVGVRSTSAPTATPSPSRYSNGCTNEANTLLTQNRRNDGRVPEGDAHRNRVSTSPSLVDQRATGEVQEHVFEAGASHQGADGCKPRS